MQLSRRFLCSVLAALVLSGLNVSAAAADVVVFSTPTLKASLEEIAPRFEQATGHRLVLRYDSVAALKRRIEAGEPFEVALLLLPAVEDLVKQGRLNAASVTPIARAAIGLAVRAGAELPDVSSVDAVKAALTRASSYAYGPDSASGTYFVQLLERLEIQQAQSKLRPVPGGKVMQAVANGEAEVTVITIPNIIGEPGVMLAGTLPDALQNYTTFIGAVSAVALPSGPGYALMQFLGNPETTTALGRHGLERGRREPAARSQ